MKKYLVFACAAMLSLPMLAGNDYRERQDPHPLSAEPWQAVKGMQFGWGSSNVRYRKNDVPQLQKDLSLYAWRGERVSAQAVLLAPTAVSGMTFEISDLRCGKSVIAADNVRKYFVRYSIGDSYRQPGKQRHEYDSCLVADYLDDRASLDVEAQTLRPVWLDIRVPQSAQPGLYKGTVTARCNGRSLSLPFTLKVSKRVLPQPKDWAFHLDLWQNPYAAARYFGVPLWSKEHFDLMRPCMTLLAEAGQKVITCSIIQHPWNCQTYDPFESMIGKFRHADGKWSYDYSVFDKWVEFMMSCGIDKQIDCYTLVPWGLNFDYYDMAANSTVIAHLEPGSKEYDDYVIPFMTDFARHLKQRGWFSRTCIAMDERPAEIMHKAHTTLFKTDPNWRIEGAANTDYDINIQRKMYDISVAYQRKQLTPEMRKERSVAGGKATFYTCCSPEFPNTFTFSDPAESAYMGWHAIAAGDDGYLRWAYNSWAADPCADTRYTKHNWASGDCWLVYPTGSSIRMEKLVEGIQSFEKVRILRGELTGTKLQKLNQAVAPFAKNDYKPEQDAARMINQAQAVIRSLE